MAASEPLLGVLHDGFHTNQGLVPMRFSTRFSTSYTPIAVQPPTWSVATTKAELLAGISEASSVSKSDTEAVIGAFVDLGRSWSFLQEHMTPGPQRTRMYATHALAQRCMRVRASDVVAAT